MEVVRTMELAVRHQPVLELSTGKFGLLTIQALAMTYQTGTKLIKVFECCLLEVHVATVCSVDDALHVWRLLGQHSLGDVDVVFRLASADEDGDTLMSRGVRGEVVRLDPGVELAARLEMGKSFTHQSTGDVNAAFSAPACICPGNRGTRPA